MLCFQVVLWSTLFKYHLELGHYKEAFEAMMANPDPIRYILLPQYNIKIMVILTQFTLCTQTPISTCMCKYDYARTVIAMRLHG